MPDRLREISERRLKVLSTEPVAARRSCDLTKNQAELRVESVKGQEFCAGFTCRGTREADRIHRLLAASTYTGKG
jgi:hypothetical protein